MDVMIEEPSLGVFLRRERELRGITLEQVASATKVGTKTLYLLEADHYAELPAKPFVRGFVVSYCRFIGINSQEVLTQFEDFIQKKSLERPKKDAGHSGYAFDRRDTDVQSRTYLLIAMLCFLILGGAVFLLFRPSLGSRKKSNLEKLQAVKLPSSTTQEALAVVSSPVTPSLASPVGVEVSSSSTGVHRGALHPSVVVAPAILPTPVSQEPVVPTVPDPVPQKSSKSLESLKEPVLKPQEVFQAGENPKDPLDSGLELKPQDIHHRLVFKMLETVWVRYQVDDRPMRKFLVRKGNLLILRAKDKIHFQISNPQSAIVSYNRKGEALFASHPDLFSVGRTTTLSYPKDLTKDFFKKESPLPETPPPSLEEGPIP